MFTAATVLETYCKAFRSGWAKVRSSRFGRNGVGKTTLMRTVMGLLPLHSGTIRYRGESISTLSPQRRASLGFGYVPQGKMIFPFLTVAENLKMGERVGGAARSWAPIFDMF